MTTRFPITVVEKTAGAVLSYGFNWNSFLGNDTIDSSEWSVDPASAESPPEGLVLTGSDHDSNTTSIKVSGGQPNTMYRLTNTITFGGSPGQTEEQYLDIAVI